MAAALLLACVRGGRRRPTRSRPKYRIKAAFVCKFGNYVDWPAGARGDGAVRHPARYAADAVVEELARAAAADTVGGRPIVVRRLARGEPLDTHRHRLRRAQSTPRCWPTRPPRRAASRS